MKFENNWSAEGKEKFVNAGLGLLAQGCARKKYLNVFRFFLIVKITWKFWISEWKFSV